MFEEWKAALRFVYRVMGHGPIWYVGVCSIRLSRLQGVGGHYVGFRGYVRFRGF